MYANRRADCRHKRAWNLLPVADRGRGWCCRIEEWKPIIGYPNYRVSNLGRVYSKNVNRILVTTRTRKKDGYEIVMLSKDGKSKGFLVHRLVYQAFVGEIPDGMQINHIDENKLNNNVENLETVTPSQNVSYGSASERRWKTLRSKYPEWPVQLRKPCRNETTGEVFASVSEAARAIGCRPNCISNACSKRRKTYHGQVWSYI